MYLTGGATAVLAGWRDSTVDIDVRFEPDSDAALSRIQDLKEELEVNVELASPLDFLPDFDLYSQALSKIDPEAASGNTAPAAVLTA
jgi:hypothetical protein